MSGRKGTSTKPLVAAATMVAICSASSPSSKESGSHRRMRGSSVPTTANFDFVADVRDMTAIMKEGEEKEELRNLQEEKNRRSREDGGGEEEDFLMLEEEFGLEKYPEIETRVASNPQSQVPAEEYLPSQNGHPVLYYEHEQQTMTPTTTTQATARAANVTEEEPVIYFDPEPPKDPQNSCPIL